MLTGSSGNGSGWTSACATARRITSAWETFQRLARRFRRRTVAPSSVKVVRWVMTAIPSLHTFVGHNSNILFLFALEKKAVLAAELSRAQKRRQFVSGNLLGIGRWESRLVKAKIDNSQR
jgi:hypothetical protein